MRKASSETSCTVAAPAMPVARMSAVLPAVSGPAVQRKVPLPNRSTGTPPAIGIQLAPLSVESSRFTVGAATPPELARRISMPERIAPLAVRLTRSIAIPPPAEAVTAYSRTSALKRAPVCAKTSRPGSTVTPWSATSKRRALTLEKLGSAKCSRTV
jgi:hypothetical protein